MGRYSLLGWIIPVAITAVALLALRARAGRRPAWLGFLLLVPATTITLIATGAGWTASIVRAITLVTAGGAVAVGARRALGRKSLHPLLPRRYDFGKRRDTLRETLRLLEERGARTLLETGVARRGLSGTRGDGASTIVFAAWARQHGATLDSIDIDGEAIVKAAGALRELGLDDVVRLHRGDSIELLSSYEAPVDFLYLDSYDYHPSDRSIQEASQRHHLAEFKAIESRLHEATVVLIDDCDLPGGGKGRAAVDYMRASGWKPVLERYQMLLVRDV